MKTLHRIDAWLLAKLFQGLIDLTQKGPAWWLEQCSFAIFLSGAGFLILWDFPAWYTAIAGFSILLVAAVVFLESRWPELMEAKAASDSQRRAFLAWVVLYGLIVALLTVVKPDTVAWLILVNHICMLAAYYFAACKPPKPRQPRRKLSMGGAA